MSVAPDFVCALLVDDLLICGRPEIAFLFTVLVVLLCVNETGSLYFPCFYVDDLTRFCNIHQLQCESGKFSHTTQFITIVNPEQVVETAAQTTINLANYFCSLCTQISFQFDDHLAGIIFFLPLRAETHFSSCPRAV